MTTEITTTEQNQAINAFNITQQGVGQMITSFVADEADRATSVQLFNAMNNPQEKISDHINEEIEVENYLVEMTEIEDEGHEGNKLGTFSTVPRVVFVTPEGIAYQAVSFGMARVVRNIIAVCGNAPWKPAIKLKIKQQPTKKGSMLTADMLG